MSFLIGLSHTLNNPWMTILNLPALEDQIHVLNSSRPSESCSEVKWTTAHDIPVGQIHMACMQQRGSHHRSQIQHFCLHHQQRRLEEWQTVMKGTVTKSKSKMKGQCIFIHHKHVTGLDNDFMPLLYHHLNKYRLNLYIKYKLITYSLQSKNFSLSHIQSNKQPNHCLICKTSWSSLYFCQKLLGRD